MSATITGGGDKGNFKAESKHIFSTLKYISVSDSNPHIIRVHIHLIHKVILHLQTKKLKRNTF